MAPTSGIYLVAFAALATLRYSQAIMYPASLFAPCDEAERIIELGKMITEENREEIFETSREFPNEKYHSASFYYLNAQLLPGTYEASFSLLLKELLVSILTARDMTPYVLRLMDGLRGYPTPQCEKQAESTTPTTPTTTPIAVTCIDMLPGCDTAFSDCYVQDDGELGCRCVSGYEGDGYSCNEEKFCNPPEDIENASYDPVKEAYEEDDVITYTCNPGFKLRGSTQWRCSWRETWDYGDDTSCVSGEEQTTTGPDISWEEETTTPGFVPWVSDCVKKLPGCDEYYSECYTKDDGEYGCRCAAGYAGNGYSCYVERLCIPPEDIENASYDPVKELYEEDDVITYTCDPGFKLNGSSQWTCSWRELWDYGDDTSCVSEEDLKQWCGSPDDIVDGEYSPIRDMYAHDEVITYSCNSGFILNGDSQRTCGWEKTWLYKMDAECDLESDRSKLVPEGWWRGSNNRYYKYFEEKVDYQTAKSRCASFNASLAATGLRDPDVRTKVKGLLADPITDTWIGLDDLASEESFVWGDEVESTNQNTDWGQAMPVYGWRCGVMGGSYYRGQIANQDCTTPKSFLCEF